MKPSKAKQWTSLVKADHPALTKVAKPVEFDGSIDLRQLHNDMLWLCQEHDGAGLAAPQVGESVRMVVINFAGRLVMVNPVMTWHNDTIATAEEGCLSYPGHNTQVNRYTSIKVEYQTVTGQKRFMSFNGIRARVVQHELDHLEGKCINRFAPTAPKGMSSKGARAVRDLTLLAAAMSC